MLLRIVCLFDTIAHSGLHELTCSLLKISLGVLTNEGAFLNDLHVTVADMILRMVPKLMGTLASDLRRTLPNLAPGHFQVLASLAPGERNLTTLAADMAVSLPTISRTIATLSDRGWVTSRRDPADRRCMLISLSADGKEILHTIRADATETIARALAPLSSEDCLRVLAGLDTLGALFEEESTPDAQDLCERTKEADPRASMRSTS